jgi:DNA-directed RNA polymerase subunit omega
MIEELKSTELINKVGGRFKLTALIQKRLDELVQGARPLIEDTEGKTMLEIVIQEILQDKITAETQDSESTKPDEEKDQPRI